MLQSLAGLSPYHNPYHHVKKGLVFYPLINLLRIFYFAYKKRPSCFGNVKEIGMKIESENEKAEKDECPESNSSSHENRNANVIE